MDYLLRFLFVTLPRITPIIDQMMLFYDMIQAQVGRDEGGGKKRCKFDFF